MLNNTKGKSLKSQPSPGIRPDTCQIINLRANSTKRWPRVGRVPGKDKIKRPHPIERQKCQNSRLRAMASWSLGRNHPYQS